jgi:hypothetical protein
LYKIEAKRTSSLVIVKKRKNLTKNEASFLLLLNESKKNEYNRSSTIEDLPLLAGVAGRGGGGVPSPSIY